MRGTRIKFVPSIVISGANIRIGLTHLFVIRFLIFGQQLGCIGIDDFILGIGKIDISPYSPVGIELSVKFQFYFKPFILYLT
ncbi:hypothetical protein D3C71_1140550 [compost metagenome]